MENLPPDILELLDALIGQIKTTLQSNLIGIYLHGSLAMGCFNPRTSDIDFLVVLRTKPNVIAKQRIIDSILALSEKAPANGFEFSVILLRHLKHFIYPTPFELHYSNHWKERYQARTVDFEQEMTDPDLAAHFVITRARGICLYGQPIERVFPKIPDEDYLQSILGDAEAIFQNVTLHPVYSVLNLCRILAYKSEGLITSKTEAGEWALRRLDKQYFPLVAQALNEYESISSSHDAWSEGELKAFATYIRNLL